MRVMEFITRIFLSQSGVSSKRVCGFIGWIACITWISYYVFTRRDIPGIVEIFILSSVALLGLDTIPKSIRSFNSYRECKNCNDNNEDSCKNNNKDKPEKKDKSNNIKYTDEDLSGL